MNGLLVRVASDQSEGGGYWNSPVDSLNNEFVYVAIPECRPNHAGMEKPYSSLTHNLAKMGITLPRHLSSRTMHLDPDFSELTYGDVGERAKQLQANLQSGDIIVFYSGLSDIRNKNSLVYAIIGFYVVQDIIFATSLPQSEWDINAHSRRELKTEAKDVIVRANPESSGRLERCIKIGEYRDRAYRVTKELLEEWGGLSVNDGYIQRSARLPRFLDVELFLRWWKNQNPVLVHSNN